MDETLLRRIVGVLTIAVIALLLSWLLPRPGLEHLGVEPERVVSIDLGEGGGILRDSAAPNAPEPAPPPESEAGPALPGGDEPVTPAPPELAAPVTPEPEPSTPVAPPPSKPAPRPDPAPDPEPEPAPKPKPEPKPAPAPAPEPKAEPVAPALTPSSDPGGTYLVQAGAFSQIESARAQQARCNLQGLECRLMPAETEGGTIYRVRCGPYASRDAAEAGVSALGKAGIKAAVVSGGG